MKKSKITFISVAFNATKDYELQRLSVSDWKKERSISGVTRYIVKNFDICKPLKELLLRKGYKKSDFGTMAEPNFSFILSHMSDKAKFQLTRIKPEDPTLKPSYAFLLDNEGNRVARSIYQLGTILSELRKIDNVVIESK